MGQQEAHNTFGGGLISDLNPITTPNTVLTDCKNGTFITYNGNELVLQNDMGNVKIVNKTTEEDVALSAGFIPVGVKEYGGVVYIVSHNPENGKTELGSFPSPLYGSEVTVLGKTFTLSLPTDVDKSVLLSDQIFKPGDPFIINIPELNYTDFTKNSDRKIYKLRIISVGSAELDITDYFTKDLDSDTNLTNDLTLVDTNFDSTDYATHLSAKKVLYYPNNVRSGKLALKVILENIETFQLTNGPVAANINGDAFDLIFKEFFIENAAALKVKDIELKYWYIKNGERDVDPTTLIFSVTDDGLPGAVDTSSTLKIEVVDRQQLLDYEITPFANRTLTTTPSIVKIAFKDFIIRNQIDLSKNDFDWILKILFKKISNSYAYTLDGMNTAGNITKELLAITPNVENPQNVSIISKETALFQNLKFFTTAATNLEGNVVLSSVFEPIVFSGDYITTSTMTLTNTTAIETIGSIIGLGFDVHVGGQWRYVGIVESYTAGVIELSGDFFGWNDPTFSYRLVKKVGTNYKSDNLFSVSESTTVILDRMDIFDPENPINPVYPTVSLAGGVFVCKSGYSKIISHTAGTNTLVLENALQGNTALGGGWQVRMGYTKNYKIVLKASTNEEIILNNAESTIFYDPADSAYMNHSWTITLSTFPFVDLLPNKDYTLYTEFSSSFLTDAWEALIPDLQRTNTAINLITPNNPGEQLTPLITPTGVVKGVVSKFYRVNNYTGDITNSVDYKESMYKSEDEIISNGDFTTQIVSSSSTIGIWYGTAASRTQSLHFYEDNPKFYIVLNQGNKISQILHAISDSANYTICFYATGVGVITVNIGGTVKTVNTTGDWKLHHVTSSFPSGYPIEFTATTGNISITNISMQIGDYIERPDAWSLVVPTHNFITTTGQYIPTTEYNLKGVYTVDYAGTATFTNYDPGTNPIVPTTTDNLN